MTHAINIVPCTLAHIRALGPRLREGDRREVCAGGGLCRHVLHALYRNSTIKKAATVDGEIAAAWGVCGSPMSPEGEPWLFTTPAVEKVPVSTLKVARRELSEMLKLHPALVSSVASEYTKSVRFLKRLGFEFGAEHLIGKHKMSFREIRKER